MKRSVLIVAIVLGALGALAIRVVVEGRSALAAGEAAEAQGQLGQAIRAYETAARWYLPLAPHVDEAYGKLRALSASGEPGVALTAWRSIRSAARATRNLWQPHADDLAAADAAIAKLSAADPAGGRIADDKPAPDAPAAEATPAQREAWHRARLARDSRPSTGAAALAALGILLWIGGAAVLAARGLDGAGRLVRRPAVGAGVAIVIGVVVWVAGLYNA